ncbi:hypothetical protein ACH5RR_016028 [Cinchona calisaya]|uniref:DDB1- and CUL4-associated factor 4 n=1 Tax=Cinchona calisaya TaxID=153742 RepID=A0ABD2ZUT8_9GENT
MPKEIPGFYYDEEKNRYFPIKGPIPGSSRKRKSKSSAAENSENSASETGQARKRQNSIETRSKLLQFRELCGNIIPYRKGRLNFQTAYQNKIVSQPLVWKYDETKKKVDNIVEQIGLDIFTPAGLVGTDVLMTGGLNGALSLFQVGKVGQEFHDEVKCVPSRVWPVSTGQQAECTVPRNLWLPIRTSKNLPSDVSSIKKLQLASDGSLRRNVLVTTMGSGTSRGVAYILDLTAPLDYYANTSLVIQQLASFESTIWNADCNCNGNKVAIGTNLGAFLIDVDSGASTQVLRCNSDVLCLQLDSSENIILCGLRSGTIVTVDARQKYQEFSSQYQNPHGYRGSSRSKLRRNVHSSCKISMPSSISCLTSLNLYDHHFLASSMDGSIKLYDQRLMQKGAIQSYEGNVNSHTRIQLGVDPSERFVVSGGEDCKLRLWSIKSSEMLFEGQFTSSVPSVVCWPKTGDLARPPGALLPDDCDYWLNHQLGVWLGSGEGLFYMDWC